MRLGIVPYSNCIPLVQGISCEIFQAPPSQLAQLAAPDDIIMAPVVTAFFDPTWHLIEGVGIGSFGAVDTVKLFFRKKNITPQNINIIYTDSDSLTSLNLLKILLAFRYERNLAEIKFIASPSPFPSTEGGKVVFPPPLEGGGGGRGPVFSDGWLLIGDKVWAEDPTLPSLDLGECWTTWTGLPFVYACWMTKSATVGKEWKAKLVKQTSHNLKALEKISPDTTLLNYWRKLVYSLGDPQKQAIALFQKYWGELNHQKVVPLQWI